MRHAIGRWKCAACLRASRQQSTLASAEASVPAASTSERPRLSYAPLSGPVQRYNALIDRYGDKGRLPAALQVAAQLKQTLLKLEEKPDTTTYEKLAKAFAVHGLYREAIRLIDDAMAAGVEPDVGVYNQVLRVGVCYFSECCRPKLIPGVPFSGFS